MTDIDECITVVALILKFNLTYSCINGEIKEIKHSFMMFIKLCKQSLLTVFVRYVSYHKCSSDF